MCAGAACAAPDTVFACVCDPLPPRSLPDAGLSDSSSKVQVSAVNMLNLALSQHESAAVLGPLLEAEQGTVLAALSGLLDHSLALLRAKALVSIMLLRRCACGRCSNCPVCVALHVGRVLRMALGASNAGLPGVQGSRLVLSSPPHVVNPVSLVVRKDRPGTRPSAAASRLPPSRTPHVLGVCGCPGCRPPGC